MLKNTPSIKIMAYSSKSNGMRCSPLIIEGICDDAGNPWRFAKWVILIYIVLEDYSLCSCFGSSCYSL